MSSFFDRISKSIDNYQSLQRKHRQQQALTIAKDNKYKAQGYTLSQEKLILSYLHSHKLIEITQNYSTHQTLFYCANFVGLVLGGVSSLLPYLVKEFHSFSNGKKNITKLILFFVGYGATVYPFYQLKRLDNQTLIAQNIQKLKQAQQPSV